MLNIQTPEVMKLEREVEVALFGANAAKRTLNDLRCEYAAAVLTQLGIFPGAITAVFVREEHETKPRLAQVLYPNYQHDIDTTKAPSRLAEKQVHERHRAALVAEQAIQAIGSDRDILASPFFDSGDEDHEGWYEFNLGLDLSIPVITGEQFFNDDTISAAQYYGQFVTRQTLQRVHGAFTLDRLRTALATDEDLDSIDLAGWEALTVEEKGAYHVGSFRPLIEYDRTIAEIAGLKVTRETLVAIAKAAAVILVEQNAQIVPASPEERAAAAAALVTSEETTR